MVKKTLTKDELDSILDRDELIDNWGYEVSKLMTNNSQFKLLKYSPQQASEMQVYSIDNGLVRVAHTEVGASNDSKSSLNGYIEHLGSLGKIELTSFKISLKGLNTEFEQNFTFELS
jgi:hypothetical protein